jgi:hypothetical protein
MGMNGYRWAPSLLVIMLLMLPGCGKDGKNGSELSGKVTFNGATLAYGQVTVFDDKSEILATANIIEGEYKVSDLPSGTVTLVVQTIGPHGEAVGFEVYTPPLKDVKPLPPDIKKSKTKELPETARKAIESLTPIPLKYTSPKQSGLTVTLDGTAKVYNIEMTGKGERPKAPPVKPR